MNVWVVLVTYNSFENEVNLNEGYKTYNEAKLAVLKKIKGEIRNLGDFIFIDVENEITYELKSVTIY